VLALVKVLLEQPPDDLSVRRRSALAAVAVLHPTQFDELLRERVLALVASAPDESLINVLFLLRKLPRIWPMLHSDARDRLQRFVEKPIGNGRHSTALGLSIEPLRDDNSVVITASSPDRTSFGCEPGRDFTYFGEAYFRDALTRTRSFVQAFEMAKASVAKQEAAEKLEASLPQMWAGRAIAERLKQAADSPHKE